MQEAEVRRGFWGVIIPMEILDNTDISANEKIVYCYIASYTKVCLDSNERIAERLGIGVNTVSRALKSLGELGYVFVEFINGDNSKRRIYAIHENPKKVAYLAKKGLFNSFPHSHQNGGSSHQNGVTSHQNGESQNGGESHQIGEQRIKNKKNKEDTEQKPNMEQHGQASSAGDWPARSALDLPRPKRADFTNDEEYSEACYNWQTIYKGAI